MVAALLATLAELASAAPAAGAAPAPAAPPALAAWRARFNPLDDGRAAERVVARILAEGLLVHEELACVLRVEAGRPLASSAHGEREGDPDERVVLGDQLGHPGGHVHVDRLEHAGLVEGAQQPGRAAGTPVVPGLPAREVRGGGLGGHVGPRPSSRSESARTRAVGARQEKTPAGWPSVTGVSAPAIPRR